MLKLKRDEAGKGARQAGATADEVEKGQGAEKDQGAEGDARPAGARGPEGMRHSPYLDMDVARVVEVQAKNVRRLKQFSLVSIAVLGAIVLVVLLRGNLLVSLVCILAYVMAGRSTLVNQRRSMNALWDGVSCILTMDCDPEKYLAVLDGLLADGHVVPKGRSGRQLRESLSIWRGLCLALMGRGDEALAAVEGIGQGDPTGRPTERVLAYNQASLRLIVAADRGDAAGIDEVVDVAGRLYDKLVLHDPLCAPAELLLASARAEQALATGDLARAAELSGEASEKAQTRQQCLGALYVHGRAEDGLGDVREAARDLSRVAGEGGTLAVRRRSEEWLAAHPGALPAPDAEPARDAAADAEPAGDAAEGPAAR
jgi:hypothetical protein